MSRLLTIEPFSVGDSHGGARIMTSLLADAPMAVLAVSTSPRRSAQIGTRHDIPEVHLPARPTVGRLETTRASRALGVLDRITLDRLTNRLARLASGTDGAVPQVAATCLHSVPHSLDFVSVQRVAARLRLPMFLSLHDDPGYALQGRPEREYALRRLGEAWRDARQRFVISEDMGVEMCRRYGERPYVIVTDGLETVASAPRPRVAGRLSVYFMGAAHIPYADNFQCLLTALAQIRGQGVDARLITRAGHLPFPVNAMGVPIESRPWGEQVEVLRDFDDVDLLYMPLPFGRNHAELVRFSMSTKMVTYLGSGVPVLLHGPEDSAAGNLLRGADAAFVSDSLDVRAVAEILAFGGDRGSAVAHNALRLARKRFLLSEVRARFWQPILEASERADAARERRERVPARSTYTPVDAVPRTSIGVVIPCYESRRFLRDTIESLLQQTRQPDHVVVIDDGSTDDPETTITDLVEHDDRLRVARQDNAGVAAARNRGADLLAECDLLLFLDADDMLAPMMLERLASVLQDRPSAAMAWCLPDFVDEHGRPTSAAPWAPRRRRRGMWRIEDVPDTVPETSFASLFAIPGIVPSVSLLRASAFIAAGRWDPSFGHGYEDLDLFLRLRLHGDVLFVPERLVRYRRHAAQSTSNADHYWHQEQKLRARWRDLESLDHRERALVLDAWRFWDRRLVLRRAGSVARTKLHEGEWWRALRAVLGGALILARSLVRHRRSVPRA